MVGQALLLQGAFLFGELACITALARRAHAQVQEPAAQRFDLFARFRAHIETFHLRPQALGRGHALQPGHAGTDDEHLGRPDGAGGRGQHGEEARGELRGDQHRFIASHAGLRTQHVHRLRTGGARQPFEREILQATRLQRLCARGIGGGLEHADQRGARLETGDRIGRRRLHAEQHIGLRPAFAIVHGSAGIGVGLIDEAGSCACATLDDDARTGGDQLLHRLRRGGHPALAGRGFLQYPNFDRHGAPRR